MNFKLIRNHLTKNKAVSLITIFFIAIASALLSLAAILTITLSGGVGELMENSKTPHFMQMHSGELNTEKLEAFAESNENVEAFQVLPFLNGDNSQIVLGEHSLTDNLQDNGFSVQSEQFDFLLDLDNNIVKPKKGELYVPVCYFKDGTAKVGDQAIVSGNPFTIAGFIRDSQMNSTLASSKRFIVNEADYSLLKSDGEVEYLIEFRLHDLDKLSTFETDYSKAGLPANGPALTWPLFQMINAISDGIFIAVLLLIGILITFISMLCVRFTLLAKIEDDYREIGVMKAIGMPVSHIRKIYLTIYAAIGILGILLGYLLSFFFREPLLENIRLNFGESKNQSFALLFGAVGAVLLFLFILFYVNCNLRRFKKISAVAAIQFGAQAGGNKRLKTISLRKNKLFSTNFLLGAKDVLTRKKLYATMLTVVILASFMLIVPQNLYHTISDKNFVTYIGVGNCDLRLDIQQTSDIEKKTADIGAYLKSDSDITDYALFVSKVFPVKGKDGKAENMKVELGNHSVFPLTYEAGKAPAAENEIALSALNAEEMEKGIDDKLTLLTSKGEKELTICGIYSDITNGGKTAKAIFTDASTEPAYSIVCANVTDKKLLGDKISDYGKQFPYAKISGIEEYLSQTFGQTLQSVQTASIAAAIVSVMMILLVTLLFMRLLTAKDRYSISVLRAVGYTKSDIRHQYAWRAAVILAAGIILGTILAGTLGEKISALAVSSLGASSFQFTVNPLFTYVLSPIMLVAAALIAVIAGTASAGDVKLCESIKE